LLKLILLKLIIKAVSFIASGRAAILSFSVYVYNQTKDIRNETTTDNSSFSKGNSKYFPTRLSISSKGPTFVIKASQWLYLCYHSSPTSLKSLPKRSWRPKEEEEEVTRLCYSTMSLVCQI